MARKLFPDKILFAVTLTLVLVGIVMVFSASHVLAEEKFGSPYYFLIRQSIWALLGLIGMSIVMHIDYRKYRRPFYVYGGLFLCAVLLVSIFFLGAHHNTYRWLRVGSFSLQPSELCKLALIIFLASLLEKRIGKVNDWRHTLLPCLALLMVFLGLIISQPDLGTSISIALVAVSLLFCAGLQFKYLLGLFLITIPALFCLIYFFQYRLQRVLIFLDPWSDPLSNL